jgi:3-dehydrosphinganine reductase
MKLKAGSGAIVVGGSYGIGLATAALLVKKGLQVAVIARNARQLELAEIELQGLAGEGQVVASWAADATDPEALKIAIDMLAEKLGGLALVIHCVGRAVPQYFDQLSNEQFDATMKTNLYSAWYAVKAVQPHLTENGGHIVIVSSICGFIGVYGYSDYCASKFALVGLAEVLDQELAAQKIRVSLVYPPDTDTPGYAEENKTKPKETQAISANAKLLSSEDVAAEIIRGIEKNKRIIIPGADGKFTYLMKKLFPGLVRWVMQRDIKRSQKR